MPVIVVREPEGWNQNLIACDQGISSVAVHEVARPLQPGAIKLRLVLQQLPYPFSMNVRAPSQTDKVRDRQLHQDIPQHR